MKRKAGSAQTLDTVLRRILESAESAGDRRTVLAVVKVLEEREQVTTEKFLESDEWERIKETMVEALKPYPDALLAVGLALKRLVENESSNPRNATKPFR